MEKELHPLYQHKSPDSTLWLMVSNTLLRSTNNSKDVNVALRRPGLRGDISFQYTIKPLMLGTSATLPWAFCTQVYTDTHHRITDVKLAWRLNWFLVSCCIDAKPSLVNLHFGCVVCECICVCVRARACAHPGWAWMQALMQTSALMTKQSLW